MKKRFNGKYYCQKDIGKIRVANEDECKISVNSYGNVLMMVADGMGGYRKGDYASLETLNYLKDSFSNHGAFYTLFGVTSWLKKVVKKANLNIYSKSERDPNYKGMGSTLVVAFIFKDKLVILNIGDSRAYVYKENRLIQLTEDQTYVNYLYKAGKIKEEEIKTHPKRHVLTNAIGLYSKVNFDLKIYDYDGETVFLCSDGLYNNVNVPDILNIVRSEESTEQKVSSLINLGNFNGGTDNLCCALWETFND